MNPVFARVLLSFFIAGTWIAGATLLGERLGSRKAGLIANLPSNILISLLFMAVTKGADYASAATAGVPMGMTIDTIFLTVLILSLGLGIWKALALALCSWALTAYLVVTFLPPLSFPLAALVYALVAVALFLLVSARIKGEHAERKPVKFSWMAMAVRAFFAGSVVAGAVAVAQIAPPYMTGVLATFPAVLTSAMVILTRSQGKIFARSTGRIMILSSSNIIVYSGFAGILFPLIGPWLGTLVSFAAAFGFVFILGKVTARIA
jgi:hypothetical protein